MSDEYEDPTAERIAEWRRGARVTGRYGRERGGETTAADIEKHWECMEKLWDVWASSDNVPRRLRNAATEAFMMHFDRSWYRDGLEKAIKKLNRTAEDVPTYRTPRDGKPKSLKAGQS